MRSAAPVFQLYRFNGENEFWWRLISPNGRGLARSAAAFATVDDARSSLATLVDHVDALELGVRLTPDYRWHWMLRLAGEPVAEGIGDQDRRVRCTDAGHKFLGLVPAATVSDDVAFFRRTWGTAHAVRPVTARPAR